MEENDLVKINYQENASEIIWEEDEESEFMLHGEMYDVIRKSVINGSTTFFCLSDKTEKKLVEKYNSSAADHSASGKKMKLTSAAAISLSMPVEYRPLHHFIKEISQYFPLYTQQLTAVDFGVILPPPKC